MKLRPGLVVNRDVLLELLTLGVFRPFDLSPFAIRSFLSFIGTSPNSSMLVIGCILTFFIYFTCFFFYAVSSKFTDLVEDCC